MGIALRFRVRLMSRMKIRDLMLLVLHVAIVLSIVIGFMRIWPPNDPNLALMLVLSIPAASGALSVVTMRPGPRRDWVVMLGFAVALIGMALFLAVPVILAPRFVRPALGWRKYNVLGCAVFYDLFLWCGLAFVVRRNLVLRPCPHCRREGPRVRSARKCVVPTSRSMSAA